MYLIRTILHIFNGIHIPLLKDCRPAPIHVQVMVLKRSKWIIAALLISVGALGVSCTNTTPDEKLTKVEVIKTQTDQDIRGPKSDQSPEKRVVTIKDMKYNPAQTRAQIGDTILFTNKDLVPHNIADSLTKEWLSPQLNFGDEWSMIVTKSLHFYCAYHPNMEGDIQVELPLSAQKSN